jgi:hypothetical protein
MNASITPSSNHSKSPQESKDYLMPLISLTILHRVIYMLFNYMKNKTSSYMQYSLKYYRLIKVAPMFVNKNMISMLQWSCRNYIVTKCNPKLYKRLFYISPPISPISILMTSEQGLHASFSFILRSSYDNLMRFSLVLIASLTPCTLPSYNKP